jgi:DNA-binding SARP family transcriptional activator
MSRDVFIGRFEHCTHLQTGICSGEQESGIRGEVAREHPKVEAFCLGRFQLVVAGRGLEQARSGKTRALLQYLVNHANRPVSRDLLIETLWPNPEAEAAGTSLRVAVHALRRMLQAQGSGEVAVEAHSAAYQLAVPNLWLDVDEFAACCAWGRQLLDAGDQTQAMQAYARAAQLYRGEFLAGAGEAWAVVRREGLKDQYLFVLERLAETALQARDYEVCMLYAQRLLEEDRCRESTYRLLMVCHAQAGQRGRVRSWYEVCVQTLRAELGVSPEDATTATYHDLFGSHD